MLEDIITNYGYLAIFIGTALEGEIVLVIAGFLAYIGYLDLYGVLAAGFFGSLVGDQIFFNIGRKHGKEFLAKRPKWQRKAAWVHRLLEKHKVWLLLGFRFLYGFRTVTPFAIGTTNIKTEQFVVFNTAGAFIWSLIFGIGGYVFGTTLELFIQDIRHYELQIILGIIIVLLLVWGGVFWKRNFGGGRARGGA